MTYLTVAGDSWDLISYRVLGSERYAPELMDANPAYIQTFIFKANIKLVVPEIKAVKNQASLPWKS